MSAVVAQAGGLAVHEQSTSAQGSSWAGSAAGGDLSSGFWNPAAFGIAGWGFTTESHYALLIPDASVSDTGTRLPRRCQHAVVELDRYRQYRADPGELRVPTASTRIWCSGLSINSPFGLATKPDDLNWEGRFVGRPSKMFTANATPTLSYQIAPGLFIGAGVQLEYVKPVVQVRPGSPCRYDDGHSRT